jgi:DNA-binding transcriptional MerR regulator
MSSSISSKPPGGTGASSAPGPGAGAELDRDAHCCGIGDLAREFDVTPRALRFYETRGLISPQRNGQTRIYTHRDRVRLELILRGRRLGFSIEVIAEVLALYDAPEGGETRQTEFVLGKIGARRASLLAQRRDIDVILAELGEVEARCEALLGRSAPR